MEGRIRFTDVTFGYDKSKPVLKGIDLDVRAEEMIGLVGRSGVGKTTTVNLIARFYDVDHGSIEIDGVDIRRINLRDLRRQIGIVSQEPVLFSSGTIAENIGYGKPGGEVRGDRRRRQAGQRPRFHPRQARRVRDPGGRAGQQSSPAASASGWPSPGPCSTIPGS